MKTIKYQIIVSHNGDKEFSDKVNESIRMGWKPQGGVNCMRGLDRNGADAIYYRQAMVILTEYE